MSADNDTQIAMLDALYLALPFVEDHEDNPVYKPGVVKKVVKKIRDAIEAAEKKEAT